MPIVFIASAPFGGGDRLAKILAQKLGYSFLSRDEVVAQANEYGIPVGKLEVAMIKKPAVQERMARLKDRYLAVATAAICERAVDGRLVYFGRAGHHLLPGVSHVLRVHVVPEPSQRLASVMQRLRLSREKAECFIRDVDRDIRSWVRFVQGVDLDDASKYDFIVNLENLSIENAATALCGIAGLPDFQPTPASRKAMAERLLQSRARIKLALDERTAAADLTVRSSDGIVTITYMPRQAELARSIPEVLRELPDCLEIRCTMASTNILWIQERFRPDSESFRHMHELARRWGAAVEMIQFSPDAQDEPPEVIRAEPLAVAAKNHLTGGIEDDLPAAASQVDPFFQQTLEALVHKGCSGGAQIVSGTRERLLSAIHPTIPYSLVAVGELFTDRPPAAHTRMTRELSKFLADHLKSPVVSTSDLEGQLGFGPRQIIKLALALLVVAAIYFLLFRNQETVMGWLGGSAHKERPWAAPLLVFLIAPLVAGLYGLVAGSLLKIFKFE